MDTNRIRQFEAVGEQTDLLLVARFVLDGLPILKDDGVSEVVQLAHLSRDQNIQEFEASGRHCTWANALATTPHFINGITEDQAPCQYRALYLVRVCLPGWPCNSDLAPEIHSKKGCIECSLDFAISNGEFGRVLLRFCEETGSLVQDDAHAA